MYSPGPAGTGAAGRYGSATGGSFTALGSGAPLPAEQKHSGVHVRLMLTSQDQPIPDSGTRLNE